MKAINLSAEFIKNHKVEIIKKNDGGLQIVFPGADFLVYLNEANALGLTVFDKGDIDDTIGAKDLLVDQLQFVDYIQKDKKTKLNGISYKFRNSK